MRELLNKCNHDQLIMFANDCAEHAEKYARGVKHIELAKYAAMKATKYARDAAKDIRYVKDIKYAKFSFRFTEFAVEDTEFAACFARDAADLVEVGREVERRRQIEFLTSMLRLDK